MARSNEFEILLKGVKKWAEDAADIIGIEATLEVNTHFKEEAVSGVAWKARIEGTPRNDRKILSNTGNLQDSIRYEILKTGQEVRVGTDLAIIPYAKLMQEGGTIEITDKMRKFFWAKFIQTGEKIYKGLALAKGPLKIPPRPFLVITPRMVNRIDKAIISHLNKLT